jgi:hypothetical protein
MLFLLGRFRSWLGRWLTPVRSWRSGMVGALVVGIEPWPVRNTPKYRAWLLVSYDRLHKDPPFHGISVLG